MDNNPGSNLCQQIRTWQLWLITITAGSRVLFMVLLDVDDWCEVKAKEQARCDGHHNSTKHNRHSDNQTY